MNNSESLMPIIFIVIAIGIISILLSSKKKSSKNNKQPKVITYPFQKKQYLFSKAERSFLGILEQAVGNKFKIFGKVRIEDLIEVKKGTEKKEAFGSRGRIKSRHVDFVLCEKDDLKIIAAIELDDETHNTKKAREQDAIKNNIFKTASLPLTRFKVKDSYNINDIREKIKKALSTP